jgi:hypothetical protein
VLLGPESRGDFPGSLQFHAMPLLVIETERVAVETFAASIGERGG